MYGPDCKLVWACDAQGEIGKRPTLEPGCFEMSAESIVLLNELNARIAARDAKRRKWK